MEKGILVRTSGPERRTSSRAWRLVLLGLFALLLVSLHLFPIPHVLFKHCLSSLSKERPSGNGNSWCPLSDVIVSQNDSLRASEHLMNDEVRALQVKRLSDAVRVPTESYDDNGEVDEDPRWRTFEDFHAVLRQLFPLVYVILGLIKCKFILIDNL